MNPLQFPGIAYILLLIGLFFTPAVHGTESIELLVGIKAEAPIPAWPQGVVEIRPIPGSRIWRIWVEIDERDEIIAELMQTEGVKFVEPAGTAEIDTGQLATRLTGGETAADWQAAINLPSLAKLSDGAGVLVAVTDTGIDLENLFLYSKLRENPGEIPEDGTDNDGNGYTDDVRGWDFGENDNVPMDVNGHGTNVSSILLAVAPECRILPVKLNRGGSDTFSTGNAVAGIYYAISAGASVINMSFSVDTYSYALADAVRAAHAAGIVMAAAAGNNGIGVEFPAGMPEVIAVGSLNSAQETAWFSPQGPDLDITAPGVAIETTALGGGTAWATGTSMSAPMVSGAAAVLRAMNPHLAGTTVRSLVLEGANDLGEPGRDVLFGAGALDGTALWLAATPRIILPPSAFFCVFPCETLLTIGFHLPPLDTTAEIYVALWGPEGLSWLDARGVWHDMAADPLTSLVSLRLDAEPLDGILFGDQGVFPAFDPGLRSQDLYRWGIAAVDADGRLLAPIHWTSMLLL